MYVIRRAQEHQRNVELHLYGKVGMLVSYPIAPVTALPDRSVPMIQPHQSVPRIVDKNEILRIREIQFFCFFRNSSKR